MYDGSNQNQINSNQSLGKVHQGGESWVDTPTRDDKKKGFVNGLYRLIRNVSFWQMKTY